MTGIPLSKVAETESIRLLNLDKELNQFIIGQNEAISSVTKAVKRSRAGLKNPNRPIGVFFFLDQRELAKQN